MIHLPPSDLTELAQVDSTNQWMLERAVMGQVNDGDWVRADHQSRGRGRRGRRWENVAGNFYASTFHRLDHGHGTGTVSEMTFVAALALDMALGHFVPAHRLAIKWPNDLLLDGCKCAGILLEGVPGGVVAGFGVNLAGHPTGLDYPVTSVAGAGLQAPTPQEFMAVLRADFAQMMTHWQHYGFDPIRTAWLARAHFEGGPVTVRLPEQEIVGQIKGLAPDGALRLQLDDGSLRHIHAGDLFIAGQRHEERNHAAGD